MILLEDQVTINNFFVNDIYTPQKILSREEIFAVRVMADQLYNIQEKVEQEGLVHNDIKPENIFVRSNLSPADIISLALTCRA